MTSPRSSYGGGYYTAPSYPETPIYDMLVAERGTPQIAPIRVPAEYQPGGSGLNSAPSASGSNLPALPALPSGGQQHTPPHGYAAPHQGPSGYAPAPQPAAPQPAPLQQAPQPYIPQQAPAQRGYQDPRQQQQPQQPPQMHPVAPNPAAPRPQTPRPAAPRPAQGMYEDPYGGHQYPGRGY
ncbi:DUF6643 family protein [Streptomyces sp. ODS28]|uniref:DUF6643 family protein n=1 Tax=Streptomyces sp. ODS28 TaxID=3136688 RepID=UPI0031E654AB